jgi:hypothetical protein
MLVVKKSKKRRRRKFLFSGNVAADDILIGNHGNASLIARGHFNLSGILYLLDGKAEFTVDGSGQITFVGKCKHLVIKKAYGDCILDFSEVRCDLITCVLVSGQVTVLVGETKRIDITVMNEEATLKINSNPLVTVHCLDHNARIVCPQSFTPPVVVHPSQGARSIL